MKKINNCKLCKNNSFKFLFEISDKSLRIPGNFKLNKCRNCGVLFLNPQPSKKELKKYYPKEKYYSLKSIETKENSQKTRLKIFLYDLYFGVRKNLLLKFFFSAIKFSVRGTKIMERKKLLDIGSGSGQFLYDMKQLGMVVYGVEPSKFDEKGSKENGLNIKKSSLKKGIFKKDSFDIITINHVLEHTDNPLRTIKEIFRILKKKGTLIIGVPNYNSLAYSLFGKNWYQLDVPRHLFNFSGKNLMKILEKEGFKVEKVRYNSIPSQFVISLLFALNIKNRNKLIISFLDILFLPLTWLVNLLMIGDQIEIFLEKE